MSFIVTWESSTFYIKRILVSVRKVFRIKRRCNSNRGSFNIKSLFSFFILSKISCCSFKKWISIYFKTISGCSLCINNTSFATGCLNCFICITSRCWVFCNESNVRTWLTHNQKISFFSLRISQSMRSLSKSHCCSIKSFWQTSFIYQRIDNQL